MEIVLSVLLVSPSITGQLSSELAYISSTHTIWLICQMPIDLTRAQIWFICQAFDLVHLTQFDSNGHPGRRPVTDEDQGEYRGRGDERRYLLVGEAFICNAMQGEYMEPCAYRRNYHNIPYMEKISYL